MQIYDAIIIGAGAAGLFCAEALSSQTDNLLILECGLSPGRKLAASGGGKCNFSNINLSPEKYLCSPNKLFCANVLRKFGLEYFLTKMKRWKIPYELREDGRFFLKSPAKKLVEVLIQLCPNARFIYNEEINKVFLNSNLFNVLSNNQTWKCRNLILALGSCAHPKLAGPESAWNLASQLHHNVFPAIPALVPLLHNENGFSLLSGISVKAKVYAETDTIFSPAIIGDILFTHNGLSGPAILTTSLYWRKNSILHIDFIPGLKFADIIASSEHRKKNVSSTLHIFLPSRLCKTLLPAEIYNTKNAQISKKQKIFLGELINNFQFKNLKLGSIAKAEVCRGGINVDEIYPSSMESKINRNLYLIGEMLNVTGQLGGYNMHWAFASAQAASASIIKKILS